MAKYPAELKLKALGMIGADVPLREITSALCVAYPTLLAWRAELKVSKENKTIADLVDVEKAVVHEVVAKLTEDLVALDPTQADVIEGELLSVEKGVDGYKALSVKLQSVASKLAGQIEARADAAPSTLELELLIGALARLQEAFFNKNQTQIAVFGGQSSSTSVDKFKSLQKS